MSNTGRTRHLLGLQLIDFFWCEILFSSYGVICSPESTIAGVLNLSEDKTVHCRLLSNLKVRSNLQDSVVTPTKWTERKTRPSKASCHLPVHQSRGGWSHYYMHGAAPITQYMAASTQFSPLSQQIIIYIQAILYVLTSSGMCVR